MVLIFVFLLGLAAGSFLNVAIRRGIRGETLGGRSHCESCGRILSVKELIPIVSFVIQKGRCTACGTSFSWQYPIVELGTAIIYLFSFWFLFPVGADIKGIGMIIAIFAGISALEIIFVSDVLYKIIPDGPVAVLLFLGIVAGILRANFFQDTIAALILALFFFLVWFFSKGSWMGLGDAKLIFVVSLILGFPVSLIAFFFDFWLGGIVGIMLIVFGAKTLKSQIPFGPFIIAGSILAYFFSQQFILLLSLQALL